MATALLSPSRPRLRSLSCLRPLIPLRGSLLLAAHAYHEPPTDARQNRVPLNAGTPTRSEFVGSPTSSLPHLPARAPLSCETFRREPATRRFVWSFAPMPMSCHRVEHQNGSDPPPVFLRASVSTGIVHRLSGPTAATLRSPTAPACAFASPPLWSPWSVLQYGSESSGYAPVFSLFTSQTEPFHSSLAVLVRYRPPPRI